MGTTLSILLGNGDGTFADKVNYTTEAGPNGITATDFDGDGDIDLAVTNEGADGAGATASVFLNQ